jgi:hypothetical protein
MTTLIWTPLQQKGKRQYKTANDGSTILLFQSTQGYKAHVLVLSQEDMYSRHQVGHRRSYGKYQ